MNGLLQSRWASDSRARIQTEAGSKPISIRDFHRPSVTEEFNRFRRLVERLEWKLPALADGYAKAMSPTPGNAETMFKLDFFEYYSILERALYHLLLVYGIQVRRGDRWPSRTADGQSSHKAQMSASKYADAFRAEHNSTDDAPIKEEPEPAAAAGNRLIGPANYTTGYGHRFHANLIEAFESPANPLHHVLGTEKILRHLRSAKNLRNWWKDPDEKSEDKKRNLKEYDLDEMLSAIIQGLMQALDMAQQRAAEAHSSGENSVDVDELMTDHELADAVWETVPDAMEWERLEYKRRSLLKRPPVLDRNLRALVMGVLSLHHPAMDAPRQKPIIYLVHGGWHSPAFYQTFLNTMKDRGYETVAPLLPSCADRKSHGFHQASSQTDGAFVEEDLRRLVEIKHREVLIVAHSYGGCVASEAAKARFGRAVRAAQGQTGGISGMFYISAFLTAEGENCASLSVKAGCPKIFDLHLLHGYSTAKDPQKHFFNDLSPSDANRWASQTRHQSLAAFRKNLQYAGHKFHPLTYLHCLRDQAFPLDFQRDLVRRSVEDHTPVRTVTLDSSHSPFLSMPSALADKVEEAIHIDDAIAAELQLKQTELQSTKAREVVLNDTVD